MQYFSYLIIPLLLTVMGVIFVIDKNSFSDFIGGAKNGLNVAVGLLPTLILLMVGIGMFTSSGAVSIICRALSPTLRFLGVPEEILPLLVLRPISGSGSLAMAKELFDKFSPDSFAGLAASVIMGSSDTLVYVISVYFSSVNVKKTRHAFLCAFLTMIFCIFISCTVCRIFFA